MRRSDFYGEKNLVPCVTGSAVESEVSYKSLTWQFIGTVCGPPVQKVSAGLPVPHQQAHSQYITQVLLDS